MFKLPQIDAEADRKLIQQGPNIAMLNDKAGNEDHDLFTWLFMKHMTSTEVNAKYSMSQGYIPTRTSCTLTEEYQEWLDDDSYAVITMSYALEDMNNFYTSPAFLGSSDARNATKTIMANLLAKANVKTVTEAFDEGRKALNN